MSFASAARAAFALISVVTMINFGRGGEFRPRATVFRRTRRPLAPTGTPTVPGNAGRCRHLRRRRPGSGSATATRRGSWRGRGGRPGPRPRATRRANPSYARCPAPRRTLHWGVTAARWRSCRRPPPAIPPPTRPILPRPASPNAGRGPLHLGSPRATRSARAKCCTVEVLPSARCSVNSSLDGTPNAARPPSAAALPPNPPGPCGQRRSRTSATPLRYVHRYGEGTLLMLCRSGSGDAAASRKQQPRGTVVPWHCGAVPRGCPRRIPRDRAAIVGNCRGARRRAPAGPPLLMNRRAVGAGHAAAPRYPDLRGGRSSARRRDARPARLRRPWRAAGMGGCGRRPQRSQPHAAAVRPAGRARVASSRCPESGGHPTVSRVPKRP